MPPFWIFSIVFLGLAFLTYNYFSINYFLKSQQKDLTRNYSGNCVRVAVFENVPFGVYNGSQKAREIISNNLEKYEKAVKLAAKEVSRATLFLTYKLKLICSAECQIARLSGGQSA